MVQEVSQLEQEGQQTATPSFHCRHPATGHGPRHLERNEGTWEQRAPAAQKRGKRDTSSSTTVQIREDFLHAEDCPLSSFPSPCRSSLTTKPAARPLPARAHQSLLRGSAQEQRLRRVLQNNSAGIRISSPLKKLEIWTPASHTLQWLLCCCK